MDPPASPVAGLPPSLASKKNKVGIEDRDSIPTYLHLQLFGDSQMTIRGTPNGHSGIHGDPIHSFGNPQMNIMEFPNGHLGIRIENPRHPKSLEALRAPILSGQERSILHPRRGPRRQWPPEVENMEICKMLDKPWCFHTSPAHAQKHS